MVGYFPIEESSGGAQGVDGRTVLNGSGAPSNDLGANGDFYLDTNAWEIYGPKTSGAWGSGTSIIGPQGEQGEQGPEGEQGPAGEAASPSVEVNAQTGTSYTLDLSDAGKLLTLNNAEAVEVTIPANISVDFDAGTVIAAAQLGAGAVTITGDTGVTVNGVSGGSVELSGQYATASLTQLSDDTWLVSGGLSSE